MNILFLSQVLPFPLDAGAKIRSYYTLRWLAQKNSVSLLSFIRESDSDEAIHHLSTYCSRIETVKMPRSRFLDGTAFLKSQFFRKPFLIYRDENFEMGQMIKKLVMKERFDAIHADQLWMASYALMARHEAHKIGYTPRIILDQHNAVFQIPKRMSENSKNPLIKSWLNHESILMAKYEKDICQKFDRTVWVTKEDLKAVAECCNPGGKPNRKNHEKRSNLDDRVIPICVDPLEITPVNPVPDTQNILFIGGMHWPPNADGVNWFVREVFPLIRKEISQAQFIVVGKNPSGKIQNFGTQVKITGYVDSTDEYWKKSRVFIVPLLAGGGMRVKILDAWAKRIPIVSTTIGAEGIAYTDQKDILIADSPEDFAQAVERVLFDSDLAYQLSQGGKRTLEEKYDWRKIYPAWNQVYNI